MTRSICALLLTLGSVAGCDSDPDPTDGGPADIDSGMVDRCAGRGMTMHPPLPSVPMCTDEAFDEATFAIEGADGFVGGTGMVTAVSAERLDVAMDGRTSTVGIPWIGPDLTTAFTIGESVTLDGGGDYERVVGGTATLVRARFTDSFALDTLTAEVGDAVCTRGGGVICDCGMGDVDWRDAAIVIGAGGTVVDPGASADVDGWTATNVTAGLVGFTGTCEAGAAPSTSIATFLEVGP